MRNRMIRWIFCMVAVCCVLAVRRDAALARAKSDKRARAARAKLRALESRRLNRAAA